MRRLSKIVAGFMLLLIVALVTVNIVGLCSRGYADVPPDDLGTLYTNENATPKHVCICGGDECAPCYHIAG